MQKFFTDQGVLIRTLRCWCTHAFGMETFQVQSCMRAYHVYKQIWESAVGEEVDCTRERGNHRDAYAVAVVKD